MAILIEELNQELLSMGFNQRGRSLKTQDVSAIQLFLECINPSDALANDQ